MTESSNQSTNRYVSWWVITLYASMLLIRQQMNDILVQLQARYRYTVVPLSNALVTISIGLLVVGLGFSWRTQAANTQARDTATKQVAAANAQAKSSGGASVLASSDVPSTNKPPADMHSSYVVAPNLPRFITIPKLGVDARIIAAGTDKTGAVATPSNVFDTAWYNRSALPGQPGVMLIDGHISSWTTKGVFHDLKSLQAGDTVKVERGDGITYNFRVVTTRVYAADAVDMDQVLAPISSTKPGLNLISCYGEVIKGTNDFSKRIVVFTEQV